MDELLGLTLETTPEDRGRASSFKLQLRCSGTSKTHDVSLKILTFINLQE